MDYFVTGATGFIGRFLVARLLQRSDSTVFALVRKGSEARLHQIATDLGVSENRLVPVAGNLTQPNLGIAPADLEPLRHRIDHFFHLAAIYDLKADLISQQRTNVDGTRYAIQAAESMQAGSFHHVSSIAVAGLYPGCFTESMFEQATGLDDPYFYTKHLAEKCVREECRIPWRVYRPSMVVGHSRTGEMDKIDGPYYIFKIMQRLHDWLPRWLPLPGIEGGQFNIVPVDYVVDAMDAIAHKPGLDGQAFHLTAERHYRLGDLLNLIADVAQAPRFSLQISNRLLEGAPLNAITRLGQIGFVHRQVEKLLNALDMPLSTLGFVTYPVTFDRSQTAVALADTGITPPALEDYLPVLWDYWARHLDPDRKSRAYVRQLSSQH